jgi:hypothetical protein
MRAAVLLMLFVALAADARSASLHWTHTRPMSPAAGHLLQLATERSTLVRTLVEELERSDVVVLLTFSNEPVARSTHDFMTFLTEAGGTRFVTVCIYWRSAPPLVYIPRLAHELAHALELAAAGDVRDYETYVRLFRTIGRQGKDGQFETQRGRATEERVRQELFGHLD